MSAFWKPGESSPRKSPGSATAKTKKGLSANIKGMKFMMARADICDEEKEAANNKRRRLLDAHSDSKKVNVGASSVVAREGARTGEKLECTVEKKSIYSALPGRRSFGGFNKVIERQYAAVLEGQRMDRKYNHNTEVEDDDDELLKRYAAMRGGKKSRDKDNSNSNSSSNNKNKKKGEGGTGKKQQQ
jgi:hypothetical protein